MFTLKFHYKTKIKYLGNFRKEEFKQKQIILLNYNNLLQINN
jgi:hypothetical protein